MSWTEIALDMARLIAAQHGCELTGFSLDGADTCREGDVDVVRIQASARMSPLADELPWDDEVHGEPIVDRAA